MAEASTLKTEARNGQGSRDADRLRKAGRIPAHRLRHKETPGADHGFAGRASPPCATTHVPCSWSSAGKTETVLIQEIQHNHLG